MSEQFLNDPQVRTALQQMGGERVTERVRADSIRQTSGPGGRLHEAERLLASHPPPPIAEEERAAALGCHVAEGEETRPPVRDPANEPVERDVADGHEPFLVALSDDPDEAAVERDILQIETERLADPQSGRVQELEEGPSAQVRGGFQEALHLIDRERLWQQARLARQVDVLGDIDRDQSLPEREAVEAADARRPSSEGRRGETGIVRPSPSGSGRKVPKRRVWRPVPLGRASPCRGEVVEIAAIRANRRLRQAAFDPEIRQEVLDRPVERRWSAHSSGHRQLEPTNSARHASARSSSSRADACAVEPPPAPASIWASSAILPSRSRATTSVTVRPSRSRFVIWKWASA